MNLHDEMFPHLLTWQQNFLLLNNLTIAHGDATQIWVEDPDGRGWAFSFTQGLAGWVAQYKGKTFMKPSEIQRYDPADWIRL